MRPMDQPYFRQVIANEFASRMATNHRYSLRGYARGLGVPVSALSEILSARRVPSHRLATKITRSLGLSPDEERTFLTSVAQAQVQQPNRKRIDRAFRDLNALPPPAKIDVDTFKVISEWYHYAILFLTELDAFKTDMNWISRQLGISQSEAKFAVERLLSLNMLKLQNGKLVAVEKTFTTAQKNVSTQALRNHFKQMLEKAVYSLKHDPIEKRSMTAMTFAIDPDKIPKAKQMIEDFTQKLAHFLENGQKKSVYEISISLFPLMKESS
jgi:uncharacterized protein (TIGR02147 family)